MEKNYLQPCADMNSNRAPRLTTLHSVCAHPSAVPNVGTPAVNLCDARVTIGRKSTSTVVIADNFVSGTHFTLECEFNASDSSVAVFV